jgi:hypothetical protein
MDQAEPIMPNSRRQLLQACPLSTKAPFEIYGARNRGCRPGDIYLYQGFKYLQNTGRDVLIREDVDRWIKDQQEARDLSSAGEAVSSDR